jgi:hypothetical protein
MRLLALLFLTCSIHSLFADWNPSDCMPHCSQHSLLHLQNEQYVNLKKKVIERSQKSWCSESETNLIMDLIVLTKPDVCVEIGTFDGGFFLPMAASLKHINHGYAYSINAWSNEYAVKGVSSKDVNYAWWSTVDMAQAKNKVVSLLNEWSVQPYCKIIQASPAQASSEIGPIDFLHLVGGLSEEECLNQVELYLPKVKSKGYILLTNVFFFVDETLIKMKALWALLDACEIVCEIEQSNVILFRKN